MIYSDVFLGDNKFPLLAFAIHNGNYMPPELLQNCGIDADTRLREEDPYTNGFAECFPNRIIVQTSRFAVDLNRPPEKAVYQKPEDAWGLQVRKMPIADNLYTKLLKAYSDWYQIIRYQIERLLKIHPTLIILDLHSYNHRRGGPDVAPDPQNQNPDLILGRNNLPESVYPLVENLRLLLDGNPFQNIKLDCRCDIKFSGGHFSRWVNQTFGNKVLCLAIEFKKIFMDEWTGELNLPAYFQLKEIFQTTVLKWMSEITSLEKKG
ncbi:MAG TPA: N-formylglutamate amidohydrolase [Candidatus Cloacimonas acidaminovorans]|nr:N-formylglutamate amidohydrolase [Candidatus Cloacimonas acidaminovorans]